MGYINNYYKQIKSVLVLWCPVTQLIKYVYLLFLILIQLFEICLYLYISRFKHLAIGINEFCSLKTNNFFGRRIIGSNNSKNIQNPNILCQLNFYPFRFLSILISTNVIMYFISMYMFCKNTGNYSRFKLQSLFVWLT